MSNVRQYSILNLTARFKRGLFVCLVALALAGPLAAQGKGKTCQVSVVTSFRDLPGDTVRSTVPNSYNSGAIGCDGKFLILFDHQVLYDLSQVPGLGNITADSNLGVEVDLPIGLLSMSTDQEAHPALKIQFNFVDADNNTRYFLSLGERYNTATECGTEPVPCVSRGTITFTDLGGGKRRWDIDAEDFTVAGNTRARLRSCPARGKCTATTVDFPSMPFGIAIVEQ